MGEQKIDYVDGLISVTDIKFGWLERIRVLLGWALRLRVNTATEHKIGRTRNDGTDVSGLPPRWWPQRRHKGMICEGEEEAAEEE